MADGPAFEVEGPHSPAEIRRLVATMIDGWTVTDARAAEEGTDAVYFLTATVGNGEHCEAVLKVCDFLDPEAFRPEPHLLTLVEDRTDLPVPRVIGVLDDHEDLPTPAFLMERRTGEIVDRDDLSRDALGRLAYDAGRNLGQIHRIGNFEEFGTVQLARDTDAEPCVTLPDGEGLAVDDPAPTWPDRLSTTAEWSLDNLHERFVDLENDLRAAIEPRIDALPDVDPVFTHGDYRFGNLLVDSKTGATQAVLDWGNHSTGHAENDLATTEQYLCAWDPPASELRTFVREHLYVGYEETNTLERDEGFRERRETYLAVSRLMPLVWIDLWYADADEDERNRIAERHRDAITTRLD